MYNDTMNPIQTTGCLSGRIAENIHEIRLNNSYAALTEFYLRENQYIMLKNIFCSDLG